MKDAPGPEAQNGLSGTAGFRVSGFAIRFAGSLWESRLLEVSLGPSSIRRFGLAQLALPLLHMGVSEN